jgi:hypothetical protein
VSRFGQRLQRYHVRTDRRDIGGHSVPRRLPTAHLTRNAHRARGRSARDVGCPRHTSRATLTATVLQS